jgi:hypothetical protein
MIFKIIFTTRDLHRKNEVFSSNPNNLAENPAGHGTKIIYRIFILICRLILAV